MKGTNEFKKVIEDHLKMKAFEDPLFAETFKKPNKNIDDCVSYIINSVKESGKNGFADSEIFNMAVHYYDEDNIKPGKAPSGSVVINRTIKLTDKEKADLKQRAMDEVLASEKAKILKKPSKSKVESSKTEGSTGTLF